jgi:hypothetical protein
MSAGEEAARSFMVSSLSHHSYRLWLPVKPYLVLAVLVVGLKYFHTEKACQDGGTLSSVIAQP